MAVIQRRSIGDFLSIAARKLTNPLAVFDNSMYVLGIAGEFKKSVRGTLWENISIPGLGLNSFFTPAELDTGYKRFSQSAPPCLFRPEADQKHGYVVSGIRIGGRLYGHFGSIDINGPFTPGQLALIGHVGTMLALFIGNNDTLMKAAENKTGFMKYLLEGSEVTGELVSHRLGLLGWNIRDDFFLLDARCPVPFTEDIPAHSVPYLKLLNGYFPKSLACLYRDSIILAVRAADYPLEQKEARRKLEKFLAAEQMHCGVSALFGNFMDLRRAYTQSRFAADYCPSRPGVTLCLYHECSEEHVMRSLENTAELKCFCHPGILALWDSGGEDPRLLIRCLHCFLLCGGNLSRSAKILYVHRNTLIYRLDKLSELLGEDIRELDGDRAFYYLLSCMIAARFEDQGTAGGGG
jgi:hypothetical protein